MKKKALSLLLTLALCLSLLPTAAWATEDEGESSPSAQSGETHADHPVCGNLGKDCPDSDHNDKHTNITEWRATELLPSTAGYYYLTTNVVLGSTWEPASGTVLCLNGHTIMANGDFDAITISEGVTFTLTNCTGEGEVTHVSGKLTGSGVYNHGGKFNMYGGTITGNNASIGGGVNNYATRDAVYQSNTYPATFNMYGGSITGNSAVSNGGGVYNYTSPGQPGTTQSNVWGTFNMYGGSITNNNAVNGSGVYNWGGDVNITDGGITGNTATSNGGVYTTSSRASADFTMSGTAAISNNNASMGSGVYVSGTESTFTMSGKATVTDNRATNFGGVYIDNYGTLTVSDTVKIIGNTKSDGKTASNVYLPNKDRTITIGSNFTGTVGVTTGLDLVSIGTVKVVNTANSGDERYFQSDDENYEIQFKYSRIELAVKPHAHDLCGTTHHDVGGHTEESVTFDSWISSTSLPTSGTYYLTKDVTLNDTHVVTGSLPLCLNGHTITGTNISNAGGIIQVNTDNGNFILTDCENDGNKGAITMPADESNNKYGVYVTGGKFTLYNGTISVAGPSCVGVSLNRSTFTMNGGTISNPTDASVNDVDGVYVGYDGKFFMNGGTISNNQRYGVNVTGS